MNKSKTNFIGTMTIKTLLCTLIIILILCILNVSYELKRTLRSYVDKNEHEKILIEKKCRSFDIECDQLSRYGDSFNNLQRS